MGNQESSSTTTLTTTTAVSKEETVTTTKKTGVVLDTKNIPNFKVVLIGDPGVGKSSIFGRYVRNQFVYEYQPTRKFAIENVVKNVNVPSKAVCCVTLWDLPGSEDMDLRESYYRYILSVVPRITIKIKFGNRDPKNKPKKIMKDGPSPVVSTTRVVTIVSFNFFTESECTQFGCLVQFFKFS